LKPGGRHVEIREAEIAGPVSERRIAGREVMPDAGRPPGREASIGKFAMTALAFLLLGGCVPGTGGGTAAGNAGPAYNSGDRGAGGGGGSM
jgi:hypothetical protein